jgi:spore germination cell wall hydrolase CwlJ-like protein
MAFDATDKESAMKLAWILWLANLMPQPAADQLCLATTVYLEARNQSTLGQRAVAEVALRRLEKGVWGGDLCAVVTAPKQFAPTLVSPDFWLRNLTAWNRAVQVAYQARDDWARRNSGKRPQVVPGADHFVALGIASPPWAQGTPVATIGDHTFYRVSRL